MAIAKINKVSLIIPVEKKDYLLTNIQQFGNLELIPLRETEGDFRPEGKALLSPDSELIEKALSILQVWGSESSFAKLKNGRPNVTYEFLESRVSAGKWKTIAEEVISSDGELSEVRKKRSDLIKNKKAVYQWRNLEFFPSEFNSRSAYVKVLTGRFADADFSAFLQDHPHGHVDILFSEAGEKGVAVYYPEEFSKEVRKCCKDHDFIKFDYDRDELSSVLLEKYGEEEKTLVEREAALSDKLKELYGQKDELLYADDYFSNASLRRSAADLTDSTPSALLLSGWIEKDRIEPFRAFLKKRLDFPYYLSFDEVEKSEVTEVPIVLKNRRVVRAFEQLTEMYSLPRYDELDPTPMMSVFYLAFFGMMVADIGYGLVMLLATTLIKLFFKPDRGLAKNVDMFFWLSFPVMIWGVIYGSFFGIAMPFGVFNPSEDIIDLIVLSLIFGWIQMLVGLSMNFINNMKHKRPVAAVGDGLAWVVMLLGLGVIVISKAVVISDTLFYVGIGMCVVSVITVLVSPVISSKGHRIKGLMKGLYAIYGVTGYVSDLVSYSRLMSLGVAGASISVAFNTIIMTIPFVGRITVGILLAVAMHLLNLFLSLLSAYVHGIRLQFVEFFGKFYTGGGRKFSPLRPAEKHVYIAENQKDGEDN